MNQVIADFIENNADRMISDGAIHDDLATIRRTLADPAQWCTAWMAIGDRYEGLAGAALAAGSHLTAAERLWRGALACHFGQGYFTESRPDLRARASSRRQELFMRHRCFRRRLNGWKSRSSRSRCPATLPFLPGPARRQQSPAA